MKIRLSFVSNSSSSSFTIEKSKLKKDQIEKIFNYSFFATFMKNIDYIDEEWFIKETDTHIEGFTLMDNFDMIQYLENIEVLHLAEFEGNDYK